MIPPQTGHALAGTPTGLGHRQQRRGHAARARLEHHHVRATRHQAQHRRLVDGGDQTDREHGHAAGQTKLLEQMARGQRARPHRRDAPRLGLAGRRQAGEAIQLQSSTDRQRILALGGQSRPTCAPRLQRQIHALQHAIGLHGQRVDRAQQADVHRHGHHHARGLRHAEGVLHGVAQAVQIARCEAWHAQLLRGANGARTRREVWIVFQQQHRRAGATRCAGAVAPRGRHRDLQLIVRHAHHASPAHGRGSHRKRHAARRVHHRHQTEAMTLQRLGAAFIGQRAEQALHGRSPRRHHLGHRQFAFEQALQHRLEGRAHGVAFAAGQRRAPRTAIKRFGGVHACEATAGSGSAPSSRRVTRSAKPSSA